MRVCPGCAQAAKTELAAKEKAVKKAEAKCAAAEQSLKEERGREGSFHSYQQVEKNGPSSEVPFVNKEAAKWTKYKDQQLHMHIVLCIKTLVASSWPPNQTH